MERRALYGSGPALNWNCRGPRDAAAVPACHNLCCAPSLRFACLPAARLQLSARNAQLLTIHKNIKVRVTVSCGNFSILTQSRMPKILATRSIRKGLVSILLTSRACHDANSTATATHCTGGAVHRCVTKSNHE